MKIGKNSLTSATFWLSRQCQRSVHGVFLVQISGGCEENTLQNLGNILAEGATDCRYLARIRLDRWLPHEENSTIN